MRLTLMGTAHGYQTYCRFVSSSLLEVNGRMYLIDASPPADGLIIRQGKDVKRLNGVFITHMHEDHAGSLPGIVKCLNRHPYEDQHTHFVLPQEGAYEALMAWCTMLHTNMKEGLISHTVAQPGVCFDDGVLKVTAIGNHHLPCDEGYLSFSYLMEAQGKSILFTGDLSFGCADFPMIGTERDIDLCVCESAHITPENTLDKLMRCRFGRLVFNHLHDKWHGEGEQTLYDSYKSVPYPIQIGHDGDVLEL